MTYSDAGNFAMYTKGTVSQHLWESIHCVLLVTDVWIHSARSKSRTGLLFLHHMVWFVKTCFSGKFAKRVQGQSLGGSWCNGSRYSLIYSNLDSHCSFEMEIIFRETFVLRNVKIWLKNLQSFFSSFLCYFQTQLRLSVHWGFPLRLLVVFWVFYT